MHELEVLAATRWDASSYYRIEAPFGVLEALGYNVDIRPLSVEVVRRKRYDVLWLQQHADPLSVLAARLFKERGGLLVYDMDDWLYSIPPSWPSHDQYYKNGKPTQRLVIHDMMISMADVVTVTNERLARLVQGKFPKKRIEILPNYVLAGDWDIIGERSHDRDGPVVGWMGTSNHWDDWQEIVEQVTRAVVEIDGYLALIGAPELVIYFPDELAKRTFVHPLVTIRDFHKVRKLMKACDVGIAWSSKRFKTSRARSWLKALQWGAAGVPVVANSPVYEDAPTHACLESSQGLAGAIMQVLGKKVKTSEVLSNLCYENKHKNWVSILR